MVPWKRHERHPSVFLQGFLEHRNLLAFNLLDLQSESSGLFSKRTDRIVKVVREYSDCTTFIRHLSQTSWGSEAASPFERQNNSLVVQSLGQQAFLELHQRSG